MSHPNTPGPLDPIFVEADRAQAERERAERGRGEAIPVPVNSYEMSLLTRHFGLANGEKLGAEIRELVFRVLQRDHPDEEWP
jgi:hypothetical protein